MTPEEIQTFKDWGVALPSRDPHVKDTPEEPLSAKLQSVNPRNWRQEGNQLICDTDYGPLVNFIPTNKILIGVENNLPKFKTL